MVFLKKFGKFILADKVFLAIMAVIIIGMAIVTCFREGKDMKVGLYGVAQTLQRQSPYDNPTDANRPIYRYAPGFAILQAPFLLTSKVTGPYKFDHILPSIFLWYLAEIIALSLSVMLLFRLVPAPSAGIAVRNMKLSILLALPLIGYEVSNSQNKLIALAFLISAIYMFEKKREFLSAIFLSLALTVYVPMFFFAFYFIFRSRGRYIINLILGGLIVFIIVPSAIWGIGYNNFLLKDWYARCLKPFFMTTSYTTYMELRSSSQSLPSAIGRMFILGRSMPYKYILSPEIIHIIIRFFSSVILAVSLLTVWKRVKPHLLGLSYAVFLPLALITPSYCIWYAWAYLFVLYFVTLNYISYPDSGIKDKKILTIALGVLAVSSYSSAVGPLNNISVMFWGTLFYWACVSVIVIKNAKVAS